MSNEWFYLQQWAYNRWLREQAEENKQEIKNERPAEVSKG